MPDVALLTPLERRGLHVWVTDYERQFSRVQRRPGESFDANGLVGLIGGVAGIAALGFEPAVLFGLAAVGILTFVRKDHRRRILDQRDRLADEIRQELFSIERIFRQFSQ